MRLGGAFAGRPDDYTVAYAYDGAAATHVLGDSTDPVVNTSGPQWIVKVGGPFDKPHRHFAATAGGYRSCHRLRRRNRIAAWPTRRWSSGRQEDACRLTAGGQTHDGDHTGSRV